jgi:hypothetical protein
MPDLARGWLGILMSKDGPTRQENPAKNEAGEKKINREIQRKLVREGKRKKLTSGAL